MSGDPTAEVAILPSCVLYSRAVFEQALRPYPERPMDMEACPNLKLPSTSEVDVVVKDSNPIQISGAEERAAVSLILAEPLGAIGRFEAALGAQVGRIRLFDGQFSSAARGKSNPSAGSLTSGGSCGSTGY